MKHDLVRTQLMLTKSQHERLKAHSVELGVSLSEVVRRALTAYLAGFPDSPNRASQLESALEVCGNYADDGAPSHDELLYGSDEAVRAPSGTPVPALPPPGDSQSAGDKESVE